VGRAFSTRYYFLVSLAASFPVLLTICCLDHGHWNSFISLAIRRGYWHHFLQSFLPVVVVPLRWPFIIRVYMRAVH